MRCGGNTRTRGKWPRRRFASRETVRRVRGRGSHLGPVRSDPPEKSPGGTLLLGAHSRVSLLRVPIAGRLPVPTPTDGHPARVLSHVRFHLSKVHMSHDHTHTNACSVPVGSAVFSSRRVGRLAVMVCSESCTRTHMHVRPWLTCTVPMWSRYVLAASQRQCHARPQRQRAASHAWHACMQQIMHRRIAC